MTIKTKIMKKIPKKESRFIDTSIALKVKMEITQYYALNCFFHLEGQELIFLHQLPLIFSFFYSHFLLRF